MQQQKHHHNKTPVTKQSPKYKQAKLQTITQQNTQSNNNKTIKITKLSNTIKQQSNLMPNKQSTKQYKPK